MSDVVIGSLRGHLFRADVLKNGVIMELKGGVLVEKKKVKWPNRSLLFFEIRSEKMVFGNGTALYDCSTLRYRLKIKISVKILHRYLTLPTFQLLITITT